MLFRSGEYELDIGEQPLTSLEWRWVKKISGYLPFTIDDGLAGGDPDVVIALAAIAMQRAGKITRDEVLATAEQLADVPFDDAHLQLVAGEVESPPPPGRETTGEPPRPNGSNGSSGDDSSTTSENQAWSPGSTGAHGSATSASSDPLTSTT